MMVSVRFPISAIAAAVMLLAIGGTQRTTAAESAWFSTGSLATGRSLHTATLLANGKVLVAGGYAYPSPLDSAELFDPVANAWSPAASMSTPRLQHTATLLGNGKVLVAGGNYDDTEAHVLSTAELYDPATNTWSPAASMAEARQQHTATLLASGMVLVVGGTNPLGVPPGSGSGSGVFGAELYDPVTNSWLSAGTPAVPRYLHTATLLASGMVLVAAGDSSVNDAPLSSAELYEPMTKTWSAAGSLATTRHDHTATLLPSGKVLAVGGYRAGTLETAEVYDPVANTWSAAASLTTGRMMQTATMLPNGKLLVASGYPTVTAELYDPVLDNWSATGSLGTARYHHTATLLTNGLVLVIGGRLGSATDLSSAELYEPAPPPSVGGVAEQPDAVALPQAATPMNDRRLAGLVLVLVGLTVVALALGIGGWSYRVRDDAS